MLFCGSAITRPRPHASSSEATGFSGVSSKQPDAAEQERATRARPRDIVQPDGSVTVGNAAEQCCVVSRATRAQLRDIVHPDGSATAAAMLPSRIASVAICQACIQTGT